MSPRVRIAPSPTGDPHVGTAFVTLFNRAFADAEGGALVLRIDDTDRGRYQPDAEAAILRALRWLGLEWDEGPDCGGPYAPYRQSERTPLYRRAAGALLAKGAAYRCFCTPERLARLRETQRSEKRDFGYDRRCRDVPADEVERRVEEGADHTVRLKVPLEGRTSFADELRGTITVENSAIDDQILLKSDGYPTYHLSSAVDDSAMRISHVIRAEEWIVSTPKHVLIHEGLREPLPLFYHVPLLRNADQSKISKRKNPVSLDYYRNEGYLPEVLINFLARLGWSPPDDEEIFDYAYFRERFRLDDIHTGGPVFDLTKLRWLNGVYIRRLAPEDLTRRLEEGRFLPAGLSGEDVAKLMPLVAERMHLLSDFQKLTEFYFRDPPPVSDIQLVPKKKSRADGVELFNDAAAALGQLEEWTAASIEGEVERRRQVLALTKPQMFMPLRMALTGRTDSPPIFEVMAILGRDETGRRLERAREQIAEPT